MTITRVAAGFAVLGVLAACGSGGNEESEPDFSTVREAAWTVTAQEISGVKGAVMGTIGGFQSVDSIAAGGLVVSAADNKKELTLAGIDAKSGEIAWRRALPLNQEFWWTCEDDKVESQVACTVGEPDSETTTLNVIDTRTGNITKRLRIDADQSFGIEGDQLYLSTFSPADKDRRLDVTIERRSWSTGDRVWRKKTSFAIEGWGHDGGEGFEIGARRVVAYSASWEVVLDRSTGRMLGRSDAGRYEESLGGGGWLVTDSGDGTGKDVIVTLFTPDGEPVAEDRLPTYYRSVNRTDPRLVAIGPHLREQATGRSVFRAPKGQEILEVSDGGRVVVTEPTESDHGDDRTLTYQVWDAKAGERRGSFDVRADLRADSIGSGGGVLILTDRYDDKEERYAPSLLHVVDARKGSVAATIDLGWRPDIFDNPTIVRTRAGAAVTGPTGVKGLVVGP